jgi:glycosyltransferase involved in cell wall biosynthesis
VNISVVIPSFNRGERIRPTLEALLRSDVQGIEPVEIVVIDDGSAVALEPIIGSYTPPHGIRLEWRRQPNRGASAARNAGFCSTSGEIVLFVDDDVVFPSHLLKYHLELHRRYPGSVVYGPSLPPESLAATSDYECYTSVWPPPVPPLSPELWAQDSFVSSGHISVDRRTFADEGGVYQEHPRIEGEDLELTSRLRRRGIPVVFAADAAAIHLQPIDIASVCRRQYRHARAVGEVLRKCPQVSLPVIDSRNATGAIARRIASGRGVRLCATLCYLTAKQCRMPRRLLRELYRLAVSCWYLAGLQTGLGES